MEVWWTPAFRFSVSKRLNKVYVLGRWVWDSLWEACVLDHCALWQLRSEPQPAKKSDPPRVVAGDARCSGHRNSVQGDAGRRPKFIVAVGPFAGTIEIDLVFSCPRGSSACPRDDPRIAGTKQLCTVHKSFQRHALLGEIIGLSVLPMASNCIQIPSRINGS